MPISPFSLTGIAVLAIFVTGLMLIILESRLGMDKFKPALFMMTGWIFIALHEAAAGLQAMARFQAMQTQLKAELFSLIAFMAFMWMLVELLNERGIFTALNSFLVDRGLGPRGMFWATGLLSALMSPFINNLTTAMIFGKSIKLMAADQDYRHAALCNIILASNSGVWFLGTATTLMVVLAGKMTVGQLFALIPAALLGWLASAIVLQLGYLHRVQGRALTMPAARPAIKKGGWGQVGISISALILAVWLNLYCGLALELALGAGLGLVALYAWHLIRQGEDIDLREQLQRVEWTTLLFFIGVISGVAALDYVGWLAGIAQLFKVLPATLVNILLGGLSGILDNVPVEAAALMANAPLHVGQWALNTLMIGIGGSLTVIGSAAGVIIMQLDRSYTFSAHLKFLPAILVQMGVTLGVWYVQFHGLG